ncbi:MAG: ATP-binding protein, partial [Candidatus Marinimicrobia bacterium]|nr:ATP-binding protein [Candidatus Neomarinimicrobiota bacterium]
MEDISLKAKVKADPTQIHQIIMNLCTNAYHAMEGSGGVLSITLNSITFNGSGLDIPADLNPGNYVELIVADTGHGIGPDLIDKIFEPYFTTKEVGKGTGMGLSIIHGIVAGYGGTITVESELNKGSAFHVYFPVVTTEAIQDVENYTEVIGGKERILFVDDEKLLAEMGRDMLERLGYQVTMRCNSLEALATFQKTPTEFDLVITDQTMPDMTGADLSRRMIQIRPDIPIILCTGYSHLIDEH